ncbi:transmembrane amino acid transporter [Gregarina niphandrodes]|uniref:Transmembrane amino acid transporter n=1 Tax=Gregarina niphandrodes TaxID=110365 RepID=A0A023B442_GRENI|nr:transmembrane amino acid transporter [Gregarina niphandrodes]EZG56146.1 transmembrane amino acid transporter [Gregarina niphandrodes]|eukprot:XP_011131319.1 transmembrane amino acid transporter [Gregarina niphandrodes]
MLTLPYGLSHTGLVWGVIILLSSYAVSVLSCIVIYDVACYASWRDKTPPAPSYGYLVHQLLNRKWSLLLDLALVISGFGAAVSFLIFLGDFVPTALKGIIAEDSTFFFLTERSPVILFASLLCTILSTTDNGVNDAFLSAIPILGFGWCLIALVYRYFVPYQDVVKVPVSLATLWQIPVSRQALPDANLFLFAFMMQANVLPTFAAMSPVAPGDAMALALLENTITLDDDALDQGVEGGKCPVDGYGTTGQAVAKSGHTLAFTSCAANPLCASASHSYNRRLGTLSRKTLLRSLATSHTLTLLYYIALSSVGVLLVMQQGHPMLQNFTRSLSQTDPVFVTLRALMIICLIVLSPYLFSAVANGCMNLVAICRNKPMVAEGFGSFPQRLAYSFGLVSAGALVALHTDRVATVLTVFGGWGATILMCTFPAVLLWHTHHDYRRQNVHWKSNALVPDVFSERCGDQVPRPHPSQDNGGFQQSGFQQSGFQQSGFQQGGFQQGGFQQGVLDQSGLGGVELTHDYAGQAQAPTTFARYSQLRNCDATGALCTEAQSDYSLVARTLPPSDRPLTLWEWGLIGYFALTTVIGFVAAAVPYWLNV